MVVEAEGLGVLVDPGSVGAIRLSCAADAEVASGVTGAGDADADVRGERPERDAGVTSRASKSRMMGRSTP